jgi:hypothetical protein
MLKYEIRESMIFISDYKLISDNHSRINDKPQVNITF